ncbi:MAG: hypothetical protein WC457_05100, partial [Patescibacteria group bacterium]
SAGGDVVFQRSSAGESARILGVNGYVGLGTVNPSEKLTVIGNGAFGDGSTTSTLTKNTLTIAKDSTHGAGLFYVDSSGNISASGTLAISGASATLPTTTLSGTSRLYLPDGTAALPAYSFTNDTNSGIYSLGDNQIGISTNGAVGFSVYSNYVSTPYTFYAVNAALQGGIVYVNGVVPIKLQGNQADGATAVALRVEANTPLTTPGSKIVSFYPDNTTERAYIDYQGFLTVGNGSGTASSTLAGNSFKLATDSSNAVGKFYVDSSGNVNASGTIYLKGTNPTTIYGNGTVSTFGSSITVPDNTYVGFGGANIYIQGSAAAGFGMGTNGVGRLLVAADGTLKAGTSLTNPFLTVKTTGNVDISDGTATSTITKNTLLLGKITDYNLGKFYVDSSGNVNTSGSIKTFGNITSTGHIYPASNNAVDLGSYGYAFKDIYASGTLRIGSTSVLDTNSLKIGTASGYDVGKFYVDSSGNVNASGTTATFSSATLRVNNIISTTNLNAGNGNYYLGAGGNFKSYSIFDDGAGKVGFGTTGPSDMLTVIGNGAFGDGSTTSTITKNSLTIAKDSTHGAGLFYVDSSGNISASGTLNSYGAATLRNGLSVTGVINTFSALTQGSITQNSLYYTAIHGHSYNTQPVLKIFQDSVSQTKDLTQWLDYNSKPIAIMDTNGDLSFGDGTTTSTYSENSIKLATDSSNALGKFYVDSSGNVNASGTLNILGTSATSTFAGDVNIGNGGLIYDSSSGTTYITSIETTNLNFDDDAGIITWVDMPIVNALANTVESYTASIDDSQLLTLYGLSDGSGAVLQNSLGVAVATSVPWAIFDVNNKFTVASSTGNTNVSGTLRIYGGATTGGLQISATDATTTLTSYITDGAGASAFAFNSSATMTSGTDRMLAVFQNNGTNKVEISAGGNVYAKNSFIANSSDYGIGDVAEYINLKEGETVEFGDVLVVDETGLNQYKKSTTAHAKNVAGVVSDTGKFVIGAGGPGRAPLALAGLVKVKVTDENGPIAVGDYLVSASKPGYAMKYNS